ncbi:hypothetical protein Patl1_06911 [Pistacia atlantica]|uniref:Uncharacterized protein n=1 Tax=Pistacia atlantica TaxID=434234 RepID=A0ACC1AIS4_9ROSI|nr:hypothetical protein Patl1_06911 [Pistacia atlantica]
MMVQERYSPTIISPLKTTTLGHVPCIVHSE